MVKNSIYILKSFLIYLIVGSALTLKADEPGKVLQKKDIIIYDLDPSENNNHYKAIYYIDTDLNYFRDLVLNPENHEQWINNIKSAENINQISDSIIYTYVIISVKSILKKEAVVKTVVEKSENMNELNITQKVDTSIDYDANYRKLKAFTAKWRISKTNQQKIKVQLSFFGEKADFPDFIDRYLRSVFINKLYKLAYRSKKQAQKSLTN